MISIEDIQDNEVVQSSWLPDNTTNAIDSA